MDSSGEREKKKKKEKRTGMFLTWRRQSQKALMRSALRCSSRYAMQSCLFLSTPVLRVGRRNHDLQVK